MKTVDNSNATQINNLIQEMAHMLANSVVGEMRNIIVGGGVHMLPPNIQIQPSRRLREQMPNASPGRPSGARLERRTAEDITGALERVQGILKAAPGPMRAEDIRVKLDLPAKAMPRILKTGLKSGMLKSTGQKRATAYSLAPVKAVTATKPAPKKRTTKPAAKKATARKAVAKRSIPKSDAAPVAPASAPTVPEIPGK